MNEQIVITWSEAQQKAEEIRRQQEQRAAEKLQEFLESNIGMLDARDLNYYAEITGKTPNELRRMHSDNDLNSLLNTFTGDSSDDIINFF